MRQRLPIFLVVTAFALLTAGCATIPEQIQLIHSDGNGRSVETLGSCKTGRVASVTMSPFINASMGQGLDAERIALLNWNIYKQKRNDWKTDLVRMMRDKDIVLLQEAYLDKEFKSLLEEKQFSWSMNATFALNDIETGVLNASRVRPLSTCGIRVAEPLIRVPKGILVQRYRIAGMKEELLVANIHGINFTLGNVSYNRQMKSLQDFVSHHRGPVIIAGDFNNWSDKRIEIVTNMMNSLQMQALDYTNHTRSHVLGEVVDHIYYRGLQRINHYAVEVESSDHNPINAYFRVDNAILASY